jgi:50S ribosomal subunit-associated GTPase HflX
MTSDNIASSDKGADLDHELAASPELPRNNGATYRTSKRYRQEKSAGGVGMNVVAQEQSIREQIAALQAEMERLRAQNAEVIAEVTRGPPAY